MIHDIKPGETIEAGTYGIWGLFRALKTFTIPGRGRKKDLFKSQDITADPTLVEEIPILELHHDY